MLRLAAVPLVAVAALAACPAPGRAPAGYPPPKTLGPVEAYGANVHRAMTLLATSTPLKRNTVRVLFYGQSITVDDWWKTVAERLRRRFPVADLVIENRAIPGFTAPYLVKTAEADLYPFYPDLVILHVYGDAACYEDLVRRLRERTTADILHATDHVAPNLGETVDEETNPAKLQPTGDLRIPWMNHVFLPGLAKKYGTELADVRRLWKQYLKDYKLSPDALTRDRLHLNGHGNFVMAELVGAHLRHRPDLPDTAWAGRVTTLVVGQDVAWKDGKLVVPFDGNRVDLVCKEGESAASPAAVRVDGKKPSAFPELYLPGRAYTANPSSSVPPLLRVRHEKPLVAEEWTLAATVLDPGRTRFKFQATGSVTGADGEGDTTNRFVSKSGRVVLDVDDYNFTPALVMSRNPAATTFQVRWRVAPQGVDEFAVPAARNPFGETVVTVAQGLANGRHTLEVTGGPDTPVAAVRVYRPPLPAK
jgi:hypothetical protein